MTIWRKLLYYGIGVSMGVLMVFFLFGDRDIQCSYFPNDRVLHDLRKKEVIYQPAIKKQMLELRIDTADIRAMLLGGDVDFERSETRQEDSCKTYWIDFERESDPAFSALWQNCDSTATILEIH